ncbi:hypothetical protein GQ53DRAFT_845417 [Thozetella sp. PMI_491]|nr:hypothetical protein GQ53DRAFT_845417 [Thozetella sp. PMI_491]
MSAPFSFRPPPSGTRGPKNLSEFIARVSAQPGGFRSINEDDLRRQIEEEKNAAKNEDAEMKDGSDDEEAPSVDIATARGDILKNIDIAHREAGTLLEFISLLLTKENPSQAGSTLSQHLRGLVGIGSLGATALPVPNSVVQGRIPENKLMAVGHKLKDINTTADKTLAAAARLQQEIKAETKYWAEVLAVSEHGWPTFHHPQIPHTMGVRFGFTTTSSEFTAPNTAPMLRGDDGTVLLDCGKLCAQPKRIQVSIAEGDKVLGRSQLPKPLPDDAPLEQRVKEARDTIFAVELWHELNREGRSLIGFNVRLEDSRITYQTETGQLISFTLVTLSDPPPDALNAGSQDYVAELINNALHILLEYAHRQNATRAEKVGLGAKKGPAPAYNLLQPVVTYLRHEHALRQLTHFLSDLVGILQSAGVDTASFKMTEAPFVLKPGIPAPEAFILAAIRPADAQFALKITPECRLGIVGRATPAFGTQFVVNLLAPETVVKLELDQPGPTVEDNPLSQWYPPVSLTAPGPLQPPGVPGPIDVFYPRTQSLIQYLVGAVPRALATKYYGSLVENAQTKALAEKQAGAKGRGPSRWYLSHDATGVLTEDKGAIPDVKGDFGLWFRMPLVNASGEEADEGRPVLKVAGLLAESGQAVERSWDYMSTGDGATESLSDLIELLASSPGSRS